MIHYTLQRFDTMTDEQLGPPKHIAVTEKENEDLKLFAEYVDSRRIVMQDRGALMVYENEDTQLCQK